MKKNILCIFMICTQIVAGSVCIVSCGNDINTVLPNESFTTELPNEPFTVEFPEEYSLEYINDHYIEADPGLMYLAASENNFGEVKIPGGKATYRAIKNIPLDEYLVFDERTMDDKYSYQIFKSKEKTELPDLEILSYALKEIEIYVVANIRTDNVQKAMLGNDRVKAHIASAEGDEVDAFQKDLAYCLETGNYKIGQESVSLKATTRTVTDGNVKSVLAVILRVTFEEYENLVWDAVIFETDGQYYYPCHIQNSEDSSKWNVVYVPLNQTLSELLS